MVEKVNKSGGNAKLVIKKGYEHDVWTSTYSDPKTYEWLFKNKR